MFEPTTSPLIVMPLEREVAPRRLRRRRRRCWCRRRRRRACAGRRPAAPSALAAEEQREPERGRDTARSCGPAPLSRAATWSRSVRLGDRHPVLAHLLLLPAAPLVDLQHHRRRGDGEEGGPAPRAPRSAAASPSVCSRYSRASTEEETSSASDSASRQPCAAAGPAASSAASAAPAAARRPPMARCRPAHQWPVFSMLFHGSAGASGVPACRSSIETLSGLRTKAMCPSRGGRLMVTPACCSVSQRS